MKNLVFKCIYFLLNKYKMIIKNFSLKKLKNKHMIVNYSKLEIDKKLSIFKNKVAVDYLIDNQEQEKDLSIIIPVYNCENYIENCLQSIINQKLNMDYEIICINDGSTDSSLSVMNKIAINNKNIKIISQKNRGLSGARNTGLNNSKGKYILFVDSDDFICDNSINYYYDRIVKEEADIIIGRICKYISKYDTLFSLPYTNKINNFVDLCNNTTGTAWGKIYKKDLWKDIRFFEGYMYEDSIIFLNIFIKSKKIISDSLPMYAFRSSNNSLFKRSKKNYATIDMVWQLDVMNEKKYFNDVDIFQFQVILWNLSVMVYERISCLNDDEILKLCFIKSKNILESIMKQNKNLNMIFYGKNKKNYLKLMMAYSSSDYYMWKYYCGIINCSNTI